MAIPDSKKIYPRSGDDTIVYLKNVIADPNIEVGDFTFYHDFVKDPRDFEKNNVVTYLYGHKSIIGKDEHKEVYELGPIRFMLFAEIIKSMP